MEKAGLYLGDVRKVDKTYIRTKDKICEVLEEKDMYYEISYNIETGEKTSKDYSKCVNPPKQYITNNGIFYEDDIICKSNTIDELCDEFRYEYSKIQKHERCWNGKDTGNWYDYDMYNVLNKKEVSTIKGAIWTDKGLIYVAKMQKDGELVLI